MYSICPLKLRGGDKVFLIVSPDGQPTGQYYQDEQVARNEIDKLNAKHEPEPITRFGENRLFSTRG